MPSINFFEEDISFKLKNKTGVKAVDQSHY